MPTSLAGRSGPAGLACRLLLALALCACGGGGDDAAKAAGGDTTGTAAPASQTSLAAADTCTGPPLSSVHTLAGWTSRRRCTIRRATRGRSRPSSWMTVVFSTVSGPALSASSPPPSDSSALRLATPSLCSAIP
jgi:hypothetical protein